MDAGQSGAPAPQPRAWKNTAKLSLAVLGLALVAALIFILPLKSLWPPLLAWIKSLGGWGPAIFIFLYILACLLFLPAWILTVGAGFIYGLGWGAALVSLGATLGCTAAFWVGRTLARGRLVRWVEQHPKWSALDKALEQGGFTLVLLLRLSPLFPFSLLNYVLGLTRIKLGAYVAASWLGMLPGVFMYVYLGTAARSLTELAARRVPGGPGQTIFFWVGLAATVLVVLLVTRLARNRLNYPAPRRGEFDPK